MAKQFSGTYYTTAEAAKILKITEAGIRKLIERGLLKSIKMADTARSPHLITADECRRYAKERRPRGSQPRL